MFDINKLQWDDDILEMLDIPKSVLPEVNLQAVFMVRLIHQFSAAVSR